jgi:hypothetical protein
MTTDFDYKVHARARRQRKLQDLKDGVSIADRVIPSGSQYKRAIKHKPQTPYDWEDLEL